MNTFQTKLVWLGEQQCRVGARSNSDLTVATPPEFGGPESVWSPEELLVAAVESCLLSTFLYFANRFELDLVSYSSTCTGTMAKTSEGLRFTGIDVRIAVTVSDATAAKKAAALRLNEKLEKYCPVSAAIACPLQLVLEISVAEAGA
jgi:organic hydroperoxide reductase OsmC/OhrA